MGSSISIPALVLGFQGTFNLVLGAYALINPEGFRNQLVESYKEPIPVGVGYGFSLQILALGMLTWITNTEPNQRRNSLITRILVHSLTGYIFWNLGGNLQSLAKMDIAFAAMDIFAMFF